MAELCAFPLHRRIDFIRNAAASVLKMRREAGESHIRRLLKQQRGSMEKRGFAAVSIDAELQRLESAIRVEIWHRTMSHGGAA